MKIVISVLAAAGFLAAASGASAMCGHDSAAIKQTIASTDKAKSEEAMSTFDPKKLETEVETVKPETE